MLRPGFFDITLDPVIELWGFGYKSNQIQKVPTERQIKNTLFYRSKITFKYCYENMRLEKNKDLKINLSSIEKDWN